jgi:hypothetical protein
MAKVNYYLKNVPSKEKLLELKKANAKAYNALLNEKRPILLSVAYWGKREVLSTGKSIPIKLWDREQQRIKRLIESFLYYFKGELSGKYNKLKFEVLNEKF